MLRSVRLLAGASAVILTAVLAVSYTMINNSSPPPITDASGPVKVRANEIGGVVAGTGGPEAGVWVIAETADLGTKYAKIVVTDDQGRYLIPDLPKANYSLWVRGYGLADSAK